MSSLTSDTTGLRAIWTSALKLIGSMTLCRTVTVSSARHRLTLKTSVALTWEHGAKHTHSLGKKEGNVLFNDALNTFYLRLYGVRHMVKDHSDSERRNPLPPHGLLFPISSKGSFICTIPQTR